MGMTRYNFLPCELGAGRGGIKVRQFGPQIAGAGVVWVECSASPYRCCPVILFHKDQRTVPQVTHVCPVLYTMYGACFPRTGKCRIALVQGRPTLTVVVLVIPTPSRPFRRFGI